MLRSVVFLFTILACHRSGSIAPHADLSIARGTTVPSSEPFASALVAFVSTGYDLANPEAPYCSGVLIAPRVVATAGHCLSDPYAQVALGLGVGSDVQLVKGEAIRHPQYGSAYSEPFSFDLGLVILSGALTPNAKPLRVAKEGDYDIGSTALVAGYGSIAKDVDHPQMEANKGIPRQARMRILDVFRKGDEHIRDDVERWGLITGVADDRHSGGCEGDSGGPLIVWSHGSPLVAGIVNGSPKGRRCDNEFFFTNLDFYSQWIAEVSGR